MLIEESLNYLLRMMILTITNLLPSTYSYNCMSLLLPPLPQQLPIILASQSPARLELLKRIHIVPDQVLPASVDETEYLRELPRDLASRLAYSKAMKITEQIDSPAIIIGADTVVARGRLILPKATNEDEIRYCLGILSGRRHHVYTGLCIVKKFEGQVIVRQKIVETIVKFKRLTPQEIDFYCILNEGINKAGGCSISGYAEAFILFISGSYSNVMGLPLYETRNLLNSLGYV